MIDKSALGGELVKLVIGVALILEILGAVDIAPNTYDICFQLLVFLLFIATAGGKAYHHNKCHCRRKEISYFKIHIVTDFLCSFYSNTS